MNPYFTFPNQKTLETCLRNNHLLKIYENKPAGLVHDIVTRTSACFANKSMGEISLEGALSTIMKQINPRGLSDQSMEQLEMSVKNTLVSSSKTLPSFKI